MSKISIDVDRCSAVARQCGGLKIEDSFYKREFLTFDADRETKLRVYLIASAICHQTHELHHPELNLWGWDYLEYGFLQMVKKRHVLINPGYMGFCGVDEIEGMLRSAFSPDGNPQNCTLDRLGERAGMLFEICQELKLNHDAKVSNLVDLSEGMLINEGRGLYETLSRFRAFADPHRKKITFFVKLATDAGVMMIRDQEHMIPIMDYHMQRVLLRMGCVELTDPEIRSRLVGREEMDSDDDIRRACIDAIRQIGLESGHGIMKMNDVFWPLGRSCCNETTLCHDGKCMKDPCTFRLVTNVTDHRKCHFEEVCRGYTEQEYRDLWEPVVRTNFY